MYDSANAGNYVGTATGNSNNWQGYSFNEGNTQTNLIYLGNGGNQFAVSTGYYDTNNNKIYSMALALSYILP